MSSLDGIQNISGAESKVFLILPKMGNVLQLAADKLLFKLGVCLYTLFMHSHLTKSTKKSTLTRKKILQHKHNRSYPG